MPFNLVKMERLRPGLLDMRVVCSAPMWVLAKRAQVRSPTPLPSPCQSVWGLQGALVCVACAPHVHARAALSCICQGARVAMFFMPYFMQLIPADTWRPAWLRCLDMHAIMIMIFVPVGCHGLFCAIRDAPHTFTLAGAGVPTAHDAAALCLSVLDSAGGPLLSTV
jgi:hypothetical protein